MGGPRWRELRAPLEGVAWRLEDFFPLPHECLRSFLNGNRQAGQRSDGSADARRGVAGDDVGVGDMGVAAAAARATGGGVVERERGAGTSIDAAAASLWFGWARREKSIRRRKGKWREGGVFGTPSKSCVELWLSCQEIKRGGGSCAAAPPDGHTWRRMEGGGYLHQRGPGAPDLARPVAHPRASPAPPGRRPRALPAIHTPPPPPSLDLPS